MIVSRYNYTPIDRATVDGKRHYCLPNGDKVPSVTTILDRTKPEEARQKLQEWRNRVGAERAQQITTEAANRGTRMHTYLERYIKTNDISDFPGNPYAQPSWFMAAEVILRGLDKVDEYWGCEVPVYYPGLYAGTTDCVGVWQGHPAIMDFKQTNRPKKREWIGDYFIQLAAYAAAHNEVHGTNIEHGVILMCAQPKLLPDGTYSVPEYQEFVLESQDFAYWHDQWLKRVELYYQTR
jgi:genome maintenance exonuclease 1